jgi:hypothetical protein
MGAQLVSRLDQLVETILMSREITAPFKDKKRL